MLQDDMGRRKKIGVWILATGICALLGAGLATWWRAAPPEQGVAHYAAVSETPQETLIEDASRDPAAALRLGLWPGLPKPGADVVSRRDYREFARYSAFEIAEAEQFAAAIIEGSYAEMIAAVDDLSGAIEAEVAVEIGDRLSECWDYSDKNLEELEAQGVKAFDSKLRLGEILAAQMAPGVAEKAVREMAALDRDRWISGWITEQVAKQEKKHARCAGVEAVPREKRQEAAFDWWQRAADLGNLEAKAQWLGMALYDVGLYPGNAVEIAELKLRLIDAIHELLRKRYAPILLQLMMFEGQGIFAPPNMKRAWIYGEALRRIADRGAAGDWRLSEEMLRADLSGVRGELDRIESALTPAQRREAEVWVRAIVELPAR